MHGPQQNTIAEGSSVLVGQALQRNNKVSQGVQRAGSSFILILGSVRNCHKTLSVSGGVQHSIIKKIEYYNESKQINEQDLFFSVKINLGLAQAQKGFS